jgi:signal recognition particle GTPase
MAFEGLSDRLQDIFKKLRGKGKISEEDVKVAMREVRLALLEADVNYKVVKEFTARVKDRAVGQEVLQSLTPGQQIIKIVYDEMTELMGGAENKLNLGSRTPGVFMAVGLQGAGKTTTVSNSPKDWSNKAGVPCWWPVIYIVPQLSSNYRFWENRLAYRFFPWDRTIRLILPGRLWNTRAATTGI